MSVRKLWKVTWPELPIPGQRHESKAAAYRYVDAELANWQCGGMRSPYLNVYIDERDGHGWQLYERIDMRTWTGEQVK